MAKIDIYETGFHRRGHPDKLSTNHTSGSAMAEVTMNAVETICKDCGLIIDEQRIDHGPEWRAHDQDQRNGRALH